MIGMFQVSIVSGSIVVSISLPSSLQASGERACFAKADVILAFVNQFPAADVAVVFGQGHALTFALAALRIVLNGPSPLNEAASSAGPACFHVNSNSGCTL